MTANIPHHHNVPAYTQTVSIIIPYKLTDSNDIRQTMMNRLAHSIPDRSGIEVLWVDDGSTILWNPPHTHHTIHKVLHNTPGARYAGTARNTGMDKASGRWLIFADSDDEFHTQRFHQILDTLKFLPLDSPIALITFEAWSCSEPNNSNKRHIYVNTILRNAWAKRDVQAIARFYAPWCKAVRADWVRAHTLRFEPTKAGNDAIFSVDLALSAPPWIHLPLEVYGVRTGHPSLSTTLTRETAIDRMGVHTRVLERLAQAKRPDLFYNPTNIFVQGVLRAPKHAWKMYITLKKLGIPLFPPARKILHKIRKRFTDLLIG